MKDVCLLPYPEWIKVPRRAVKETLVHKNRYIDSWRLDKSWSEKKLRIEIGILFTNRLVEGNE